MLLKVRCGTLEKVYLSVSFQFGEFGERFEFIGLHFESA